MPFETFFQIESRSQGQIIVKMAIHSDCPGHNLYIYAWISIIMLHSCCARGEKVRFETFFR